MYTKLQHNDILESFAETLQEVWSYRATFALEGAEDPMLSRKGWVYADGYTYHEVMARVEYLLAHCYTRDGDRLARQAMGIPMGTKPDPHFANITCYPKEKTHTAHAT